MIYISHRGNLEGIDKERENSLSYIDEAIALGYEAEVDLRLNDGRLFFGHDTPDYNVTHAWLQKRKNKLWIHVKDYKSLVWLLNSEEDYRYFCHESDKYTLTSNGYVWSHDLKNNMINKCIVPLISKEQVMNFTQRSFYGVCTDYPVFCKKHFSNIHNTV